MLDNAPARPGAQLEQAASEGARQDRASGLGESAGDSPSVPDPSAVFPPYYDNVVKPKLIAAETNDALATEAIAEALNWARNAELAGLENDPEYQRRRDEMMVKIEAILRNAAEKAYERCVNDHDLEQIVRLAASPASRPSWASISATSSSEVQEVHQLRGGVRFRDDEHGLLDWAGGREGLASYDLGAFRHVAIDDHDPVHRRRNRRHHLERTSPSRAPSTYQCSGDARPR